FANRLVSATYRIRCGKVLGLDSSFARSRASCPPALCSFLLASFMGMLVIRPFRCDVNAWRAERVQCVAGIGSRPAVEGVSRLISGSGQWVFSAGAYQRVHNVGRLSIHCLPCPSPLAHHDYPIPSPDRGKNRPSTGIF
ncbi:unnamed protein product, partial [Mycena citricolor]